MPRIAALPLLALLLAGLGGCTVHRHYHQAPAPRPARAEARSDRPPGWRAAPEARRRPVCNCRCVAPGRAAAEPAPAREPPPPYYPYSDDPADWLE